MVERGRKWMVVVPIWVGDYRAFNHHCGLWRYGITLPIDCTYLFRDSRNTCRPPISVQISRLDEGVKKLRADGRLEGS